MVKLLVVKIFYVIIALFSVSMVFLMTQSPYSSQNIKAEISIANMQANNVVDYELNSTLVYGRYETKSIIRYKEYDELDTFKGTLFRGDSVHFLESKDALIRQNLITLTNDAIYKNQDDFKYESQKIVYDMQKKELFSDVPFKITQYKQNANADIITGNSVLYKIDDKKIFAKKVQGWLERK